MVHFAILKLITTKALVLEIKVHKNLSYLMPEAVSPTSFWGHGFNFYTKNYINAIVYDTKIILTPQSSLVFLVGKIKMYHFVRLYLLHSRMELTMEIPRILQLRFNYYRTAINGVRIVTRVFDCWTNHYTTLGLKIFKNKIKT